MPRIIIPPDDPAAFAEPLVFLAGPIRGAHQWQTDAIRMLSALDSSLAIASPRRGIELESFDDAMFYEQVDWETKYLNRAAKNGVVLFWLAKEQEHKCTRAYSQTTRWEIGEWKERCMRGEARLAVGIEEGFTGARYIRHRFAQDCPGVMIRATLEDTCADAVRLAR